MSIHTETQRLILREITLNDFKSLSAILQNPKTMLPWNDLFTNKELYKWINDNINQYKKYEAGYLAVIRKSDLNFIGIIGVIKLHIKNTKFYELGYILKEEYRGNGYAIEGVRACIEYTFNILKIKEIFSLIPKFNYKSHELIGSLKYKLLKEFIINNRIYLEYKIIK